MMNNFTTQEQKRRAQGRYAKARLIEAGIPLKAIAERAGVSPSLVSEVIRGRRTSLRVRRAMAAAIGTTVERLWPDNRKKAA